MPIDDGDEFEAIFTAMGTVAPFFEYLRILSDFLVGHGLSSADAQQIVAATYTGLLESLKAARESGLRRRWSRSTRRPAAATPSSPRLMGEAGVFDGMARAVDEVHRRLTGAAPH